jgi:hypothetical protein
MKTHSIKPQATTTTRQTMRFAPRFDSRHPHLALRIRIGVGLWLLVLAGILWSSGNRWGGLLVAPAAVHFYLAYRLRHRVQPK